VAYATRLRDGTVVDSSGERGATFLPASPGLMPCFREAVLRMRVGGKSRFVCPPALAYGDRGYGSAIPGGAALVIEAELVAVGKPLSVVGH
jgi:FKBP-type peptidyl-prolyl cis-trans isomerase FkpA